MICQVCRRTLDAHTSRAGVRFLHGLQDADADHDAAPVSAPVADGAARCDFCNQDHPDFVLPVADFFMITDTAGLDHRSKSDWATCTTCAALIERNQWSAVSLRTVAVREALTGTQVSTQVARAIRTLHRRVRAHITGPLRPIGDPS